MTESVMRQLPSQQVPLRELPASVREAGLINWVREPLADAVDQRRRVIIPPAVATMGTPVNKNRMALIGETYHGDTVVMMGDNPELPMMPERPTLADFFRLRLEPGSVRHLLQSARIARANGMGEKVILA